MAAQQPDWPDEAELEWFFERNPVRPASVLLAEEDDRVVGSVAMSFGRMSIAGEELEVGMPVRLATDPDYRGRGIFAELVASPPDVGFDAVHGVTHVLEADHSVERVPRVVRVSARNVLEPDLLQLRIVRLVTELVQA